MSELIEQEFYEQQSLVFQAADAVRNFNEDLKELEKIDKDSDEIPDDLLVQDLIQKWQAELLEEKNKKLDKLKKDIELEKEKQSAV